MSEPTTTFDQDLQASAPEVTVGLSRAGVTGVEKAVRMRHGSDEALVSARIDCFVDLDPAQKGVHMSRFPELFEEAIDEVVMGRKLLVEELAGHIAEHILERQQAARAEVKIAARYPLERITPVSGLRTQEMVTLIGVAVASPGWTRHAIGAEATGITACPCAQGMVHESSAARLAEAGYESDEIERILALVPLATHNQRGRGTLYVGSAERVPGETLVEIVEQSMSSPIWELLKRPDELYVVERAHLTPRFVEDVVREMLRQVLDRLGGRLTDDDFVQARQVNYETIHNHDVLAERSSTIGELRRELATGERSSSYDELRRLARQRRAAETLDGCAASEREPGAWLLAVDEPDDVRPVQDEDGDRSTDREADDGPRGSEKEREERKRDAACDRSDRHVTRDEEDEDPDTGRAEPRDRREGERHASGRRHQLAAALESEEERAPVPDESRRAGEHAYELVADEAAEERRPGAFRDVEEENGKPELPAERTPHVGRADVSAPERPDVDPLDGERKPVAPRQAPEDVAGRDQGDVLHGPLPRDVRAGCRTS